MVGGETIPIAAHSLMRPYKTKCETAGLSCTSRRCVNVGSFGGGNGSRSEKYNRTVTQNSGLSEDGLTLGAGLNHGSVLQSEQMWRNR